MFTFITKLTEVIKLFIEESSTSKSPQYQNDQYFLFKPDIKVAFKRWGTTEDEI
jgi:hypothetical protein